MIAIKVHNDNQWKRVERSFVDMGIKWINDKSYFMPIGRVYPRYITITSQRCPKCGWTRSANRKGEQFVCTACKHADNADIVGSRNIALELKPISATERRKQPNKEGFYWEATCGETIVPHVQKAKE